MSAWSKIADRAVKALGVQPDELIQIREHSGRFDVLVEIALAVERVGATPLIELTPPDYLRRLLNEADLRYLEQWDRHRLRWMRKVDRVLALNGAAPESDDVPATALRAWIEATQRLVQIEDERRLPYLLMAVPSARRAAELGMNEKALERHLLASLKASPSELRKEIDLVLEHVMGGRRLLVRSADDAELCLEIEGRQWLTDDGRIDDNDRAASAHVSNLPAGSVYTTVVEEATRGQLCLSTAMGASEVRLTFEGGRIVDVRVRSGRERVLDLLAQHTGDADRVAHVGIGLNPHLKSFVGWPLVDEHVHGALFVALGENRYLGGQNDSSLNIDFAIQHATLVCDDTVIVEGGRVVV